MHVLDCTKALRTEDRIVLKYNITLHMVELKCNPTYQRVPQRIQPIPEPVFLLVGADP